jgi:hypothetical protein
MFAILLSDYQLAFLFLTALIVGAAIPLAFAWARILPEEPPPFEISPSPTGSLEQELSQEASRHPPKRDAKSIILLVCVTLAYVLQFPGVPRDAGPRWVNAVFPGSTEIYLVFAADALLMTIVGLAACYSLLGSNPLRIPLGLGAELVLLLWLFAPLLRIALLATS